MRRTLQFKPVAAQLALKSPRDAGGTVCFQAPAGHRVLQLGDGRRCSCVLIRGGALRRCIGAHGKKRRVIHRVHSCRNMLHAGVCVIHQQFAGGAEQQGRPRAAGDEAQGVRCCSGIHTPQVNAHLQVHCHSPRDGILLERRALLRSPGRHLREQPVDDVVRSVRRISPPDAHVCQPAAAGSDATSCRSFGFKCLGCACRTFVAAPTRAAAARTSAAACCCCRWLLLLRWVYAHLVGPQCSKSRRLPPDYVISLVRISSLGFSSLSVVAVLVRRALPSLYFCNILQRCTMVFS